MFNRIVLVALICAMTGSAWAARAGDSAGGRRGASAKSGRQRNAAPLVTPQNRQPAARPGVAVDGSVVAVTAKTITVKRAQSGRYADLVLDHATTTVSMTLADNVVVRELKKIEMQDVKSPITAVVQTADSRFSLQTGIVNVKGIYIQDKGAPAAGGSFLTGTLNTNTTTPTLQMGTLLVKLRMEPNSAVFRQDTVAIDRVKPGQIVRLVIKTVDQKQVVASIGIGTDLTPKKSADSKRTPPPLSMGKRAAQPTKTTPLVPRATPAMKK